MSADRDRPQHLKSHAPVDKVMTTCHHCMNNQHDKCTGFTLLTKKIKCLCAWNGHK